MFGFNEMYVVAAFVAHYSWILGALLAALVLALILLVEPPVTEYDKLFTMSQLYRW